MQIKSDGTIVGLADKTIPASAVGAGGYMLVQERKTLNTHGGASVVGANICDLNTPVRNTITGASLVAKQVLLPAGIFRFRGEVAAYASDYVAAYLWNITTGALALSGVQGLCYGPNSATARLSVFGELELLVPTTFELRLYASLARAVNGRGEALNAAVIGYECYATLEIQEVSQP